MNDKSKTKAQLISELAQLREKVAELESTGSKYHNLFENLPVGIFQSTPAGRYRLVNPAFAHMVGFASPEEMLNEVKNISTLYADPADREEVKRLFAAQGQLNGHIIRHKRQDGQMRWMAIYAKAVFDDSGAIIYYDGFTLDITESKQAEEKITASEVRYRRLFESAQDAILILDAASGTIIDANPFVENLLEYPIDGLLGNQLWQISPFKDIVYNKAKYRELQKKKYVRYENLPLQTQLGKAINVEFVSNAYQVDGTEIIQCNIRDITERKQAEEALRESETRFATIFHASPTAIALTRLQDNQLIDVNQAWLDLTGYHKEEAIGKNVQDLNLWINPEDRGQLIQALSERGTIEKFEFQLRRKSGEAADLLFSAEMIVLAGETYMLSMAVDISERKQAEEMLKLSQAALNKAQQVAHLGSWKWHIQSNQLEWSDEMYRIFGIDQETFSGDLSDVISRAIHPNDRAKVEQSNLAIINDSQPQPLEYRVIWPDGSIRVVWAEAGELILDQAGNPAFLTGIAQDITERRMYREALRESTERFKAIFFQSPIAIELFDANGLLVESNPKCLELFGVSDIQHVKGFNLFDDPNIPITEIEKLKKGQQISFTSEFDFEAVKKKNLYPTSKSGKMFWEVFVKTLLNENGVISGYLVQVQDITQRKQSERLEKQMTLRLEQQAHQLQLVMDSVPEGVIVINANGHILLANPTAYNDLSILAGGIEIGDRVQQLGEQPLEALLTRPPEGLWHQISWQNQSFELIAKPLQGSGAAEGWVIVIRDITIAKEIQERIQQQERLASVGQLAAGIAHDFSNIMAVISLYADLALKDPRLSPDMARRFNTIKKQSSHAVDLIQQILDFSRRSVMERLPMDLIPLLKEMGKLFERTLPETIDFRLGYTENNFMINGDPTRLQQVIMNLVVNARDAMPDGGMIQIDLERKKPDKFGAGMLDLARTLKQNGQPPDWVRLTIQDTGTGIPADVLPHIFEPFYTTKEPGKGTGLGLAQVSGIIEQHDGEIDVLTKVGEGSTFIVYLPLLETNSLTNEMTAVEDLPLGHGETILIVEDNFEIQQVMRISLEELNYSPQIASNGLEALDILVKRGNEIALVLTDLIMPKIGGKMLVQTMHQKGITTKVIIMTGHPMGNEKKTIMALGVFDWLDKPPRLEKLAQVVARALEKA